MRHERDQVRMNEVRVVVTGLGAITPVGHDVAATWAAFVAGRSGLGPISLFDPDASGVETRVAAEVTGFDPEAHFERRVARRMDRVMQFALVAAGEALADAGLLEASGDVLRAGDIVPARAGVYIGSGIGGVTTLEAECGVLRDRGARRVSPFVIPMTLADSVPGSVAIHYGLKGPNMAHLSACASGANAIGEAALAIRRGVADVMVAGGSEAAITPVAVAGFYNMGALSKWQGDPVLASRPFDAQRDGFVIGEGAGVLVLEGLDHALARGAPILAELVGYGSTADASHITAPAEDGDGIYRAVDWALGEAGLTTSELSYINAHGTSTPLNDAVETVALKRILGERAYDVPISSIKSMIGHLLGAGGAVEAVASVQTLRTGIIPPTINLDTPDPACDLDYVPHTARHVPGGVDVVLSTSMGFGGHNAALLFRRP
jgi:3-oxoacyl-[acyl-carrier-protein] synthase II